MDRRANHKLLPAIFVFILTAAGAVWNSGTVLGEAQVSYPADGVVIAGNNYPPNPPYTHIYTQLDFIPGPTAVKHTGYFSDKYEDVVNRIEDANLGEPPYPTFPNRYYVGLPLVEPYTESLVRGTQYYWTVDETDTGGNTLPGEIWEFTILGNKAFDPSPPNWATFVETDVSLCWSEPVEADEYDVYIGTDWNDVNNTPFPDPNLLPYPVFLGTVSGTCIQVTGLAFETKYYWRVDAVYGRYPPPIGGGVYYKGDVWCFTTVPEGLGMIKMDLWWNISCPPPCFLDYMYYPEDPDETRFLTSFNSGIKLGEDYGGLIYGWLHPAKSGDYTFWLCTDDNSELYLSSDERPSNIQLIAKESTWVDPYTWNNDENMSAPISLVAGRKYYIMALWTDGTGGDHCMVAWQGPDQPLAPVNGQDFAIIPGSRLSPFVQYWAHDPEPSDGQTDVELPVTLRWEEGDYAAQHDVYIGTDKALVASRDGSTYMVRVSIRRYDPIDLIPNQRYYWAVDEVNELGPAPYVWPGYVWSFTTTPRRIYVDIDANGANNGTSWEDAYNYLQDALTEADSAAKPVEIRVAEGIYKPDRSETYPYLSGSRSASFHLFNDVAVKGGYAGFGELEPDARDIGLYETVLSGDLAGNDIVVSEPCDLLTDPTRADNSYIVVYANNTDVTSVLDGFTITACNGEFSFPPPPLVVAGGMCNLNANPTVTNCTFSGNAAYGGSGMYNRESNAVLFRCTFTNNYRSVMYNMESSPTVTNCIFSRNWTEYYGGGMYNYKSNPTVTNCTFTDNTAHSHGSGIYNRQNSGPVVTNCIIWDNLSEQIVDQNSTSVVTYSDVHGGWPGLGNIDADPCFADPCNGDYHLKSQAGRWDANSESWVLDDVTSSCIDAGNPGCPEANEPSPNGNRINMGACGGTAEASKSPANWRSIADVSNDWVVDSNDLKVFVDYWLESGECIPSDFDRNHFVDFDDFAILGLHWSYPSASGAGMTFHISDCNMEAGQKWTAAVEPNEPRFSVWAEGRYIYFEDSMYANCCPDELELNMIVEGDLITLYEIEHTPMPCPCMCDYPITAILGPFEDGTYTVEVYDNNGNSLGVVEVTIGGSPGPGITYRIDGCDMFSRTEQSSQTRFSVTVDGLYIHFEDMMTANCCPDKLELEMTVDDNLITISEMEYTSEGCRCICSFPITAALGPFEPGIYTLEVYETMGGFIGSTTVVIEPPQ